MDTQVAERARLEAKLSTDPLAQSDPAFAERLKSQMAQLDENIPATQQKIAETQKEIEFLAPLTTDEGFDRVMVEKQNFLKTQQSLLTSYQNVYTNLLSTEEVKRTTNEIDGLEKNLALYQEIYLNLLSSREDVKTERLQNTPTVEQVSRATHGQSPVKPRTLLNTGLGALAGLILAASTVLLRESVDDTIKDKSDVEKLLETKVIGYILEIANEGDDDGIYVARVPRSPVAEAFRSLRTNLEFSGDSKPIRSILVTSSGPSEGKTTVAANLAAILAHSGKKVLLVDADLRRPRVHRYTGVSNRIGLSEIFSAEQGDDLTSYVQQLEDVPGLAVLPSGGLPSNPNELLASAKFRQLIQLWLNSYDHILIDAPPMVVADPHVLSGLVDGVLLVMIPGKTRTDVIHAIHEQMQKSRAYLLGVVFNRLKHRRGAGYGGYSYYQYPYYHSSDYYYSKSDEKADVRRRKKKSQDRHNKSHTGDSEASSPKWDKIT
jgi:capsular exopolysaccharide synthesis family protein